MNIGAMDSRVSLEQQRENALRFEYLCYAGGLILPAIGAWFLRDRLASMWEVPVSFWVPAMPFILLLLGGYGFRRHRKGIEKKLRAQAKGS